SCDIYDGSGGAANQFQPAVFTSQYVGGNCGYRDKTNHAHNFDTGADSVDHAHTFRAEGGDHTHAFMTADAVGAVPKNGANMQAFRELMFCIKQ
ncbi:MAG: hypothetical protein ABW352_20495, partial [Polyangiales bacterium]